MDIEIVNIVYTAYNVLCVADLCCRLLLRFQYRAMFVVTDVRDRIVYNLTDKAWRLRRLQVSDFVYRYSRWFTYVRAGWPVWSLHTVTLCTLYVALSLMKSLYLCLWGIRKLTPRYGREHDVSARTSDASSPQLIACIAVATALRC